MNDATKERIVKHLSDGMKPKKIVETLKAEGITVTPEEIYPLKKKASPTGTAKKPAKKKNAGKKSAAPTIDGFAHDVAAEIRRLEADQKRLDSLIAAYDKTNSEFTSHLVDRKEHQAKLITALKEYLDI